MLPAALPLAAAALASQSPEGARWKLPPPEIVAILDAPPAPVVRPSPDARWLLLVERPAMPALAEVLRPWIGLAGTRVDPAASARHQVAFDTGLVLRDVDGKSERRISLPENTRIASISWSHTSRRLAFALLADDGLQLWSADVESARATRLAGPLNGVFGDGYDWMPDGERLLVRLVPPDRGPAPRETPVPSGPVVQETAGTSTPLRTWQDLLGSARDEALFDYHGRAQLAVADSLSGSIAPLGPVDLYAEASVSPDGSALLVERIHRPYSYVLPAQSFPRTIEVWDLSGQQLATVAEVPLGEHIPQEGVRTGPRSVQWQASAPATLVFAEALDGGDPKREAEYRDRWMEWPAPFQAEPREILRLEERAQGLSWLSDASRVVAADYDRDRRWRRSLLFDLAHPDAAPLVLDDRSAHDRYGDPGQPLTVPTASGARVLRQDGPWIYRAGQGAAPEGARPFLDRTNIALGTTERLWQCPAGVYESVSAIAASAVDRKPVILTSRESPADPPNTWLRDLETGAARPLTIFPDPCPSLRGIAKELVRYARADGVELSGTLYLPEGYVPGTPLPLVVWAYPLEYTDPGTAGQVASSPWRFVQIRGPSQLLFATQGYAVLDDAAMPVIGDPETVNDTFLDQVVQNAVAAVEAMAARGVADPERVGVGGHSYGAFMTANLLAHCDLFRAGIARSGAYNRTLTPFGFQTERRTLWEAPDSYVKLSPFLAADKVNEPILLIHGEKDSNQGTFPLQSERFYQAVKGNGGTARLVVLPGEDHGYRARESVMHATAEMVDWFERHVKRASAVEASAPAGAAAAR